MSETLFQSMLGSQRYMLEYFINYRNALHRAMSSDDIDTRQQAVRVIDEIRSKYLQARYQYLQALEAIKSDNGLRRISSYLAYSRYLLHIEKTIAGLVQLIVQHAVRKSSTALLPISLLSRVRQLTVTHPAIAPPQFS